jgi:AP-1 complex subunit beta-1
MENLLDIDFDGAAPASIQTQPSGGASGLEGLAGTPQRMASPSVSQPASTMDDLLGLFGDSGSGSGPAAGGNFASNDDIMNGFAGMEIGGQTQPPPPNQQLKGQQSGKSNQELLDLF